MITPDKPHSPLSPVEILAIIAVVVIWGVNNAAAKFGTETLPPLLMAAFMLDIMNPWGCCRWPSDDSLLYHG